MMLTFSARTFLFRALRHLLLSPPEDGFAREVAALAGEEAGLQAQQRQRVRGLHGHAQTRGAPTDHQDITDVFKRPSPLRKIRSNHLRSN